MSTYRKHRFACCMVTGLVLLSFGSDHAIRAALPESRVSELRERLARAGIGNDSVGGVAACTVPADCGVQVPADCPNAPANFPNPADPVEMRMDAMGILLDGDVSDALGVGAVSLVDTVPDEAGNLPGATGDAESPRFPGASDPSGFNTARSLMFFAPDSDVTDGIDDSFLYLAWDLSDHLNGDGLPPRQYDADDNNSATDAVDAGVSDVALETYEVYLQACTTDDLFPVDSLTALDTLTKENPECIFAAEAPGCLLRKRDALLTMINLETCSFPLGIAPAPANLLAIAFPTADGATILANSCIDLEVDNCGSGNNVEMVIKQVETSGAFGPHAAPVADSQQALENRFALAQTLVQLRGGTTGELSDEDVANVAARTSIPDIEVKKLVRCVDDGQNPFTPGPVDALIGSMVEYQITIQNHGNEDLVVTVQDVLDEFGAQQAFASCDVVCDFLEAELTSPQRGLVNEPVDFGNAGGFDLVQDFFAATCANPSSFLGSIQNSTSALLGTLLGADVNRVDNVCNVTLGDTLVIRFRATVGASDVDQFCSRFEDIDCENFVSVSATLVGDTTVVAEDIANTIDTPREDVSGADDNRATVNVVCAALNCSKDVCADLDNDGTCDDEAVELRFDGDGFVELPSGLTLADYPIRIIWRYSLENKGEVPLASAQISDPILVFDRDNNGLAGSCALNAAGSAELGPLDPAATGSADCSIIFNTPAEYESFASKDGPPDNCYDNEARGLGEIDTADVCSFGADLAVETEPCRAGVCIPTGCEISVTKEVRCLPNCTTSGLDPDDGWVSDPSQLVVTPGSCLQYRITVENTSASEVDVCALEFTDTMFNKNSFQSGPSNVQITPNRCTLVPPFNWDGTPSLCELSTSLAAPANGQPGEKLTLTFTAILRPDATADPRNEILVRGAADPSGCDGDEPVFSCEDDSEVTVDIQECDFEVRKDVSCDMTTWDPEIVEALPGSMAWFRFQVENTGEVDMTSVRITDTLSCSSWFVPGTVSCDVNGTDVTDCVCTSPVGNCDQISDINGLKDLTPCKANGIATTETLTCKFQVEVPESFSTMGTAVDCRNTVEVAPFPDICFNPGKSPCGAKEDDAEINVLVPKVDCDKCVCADLDDNGTCDTGCTSNLQLDDAVFPIGLEYRFTADNIGETDLNDVTITDTVFFNDSGPYRVSCDLVAGSVNVGTITDVGPSVTKKCFLKFNSEEDYQDYARKDGGNPPEKCYTNNASVIGTPDVTDICESDIRPESSCGATVCIGVDDCPCDCDPKTKAVFEIWNEFESKFSGAERCIESWDQRLLSRFTEEDREGACGFTPAGVTDYFWRNILRTDKGKARIDGVASPAVCGGESVGVPLLGISQKILYFDGSVAGDDRVERTGMSLVGTGTQQGWIKYDLSIGPPDDGGEPPEELNDPRGGGAPVKAEWTPTRAFEARHNHAAPDAAGPGAVDLRRAGISKKGSFIVFPKIEIKWNSSGDVIQDTFLDLTNDYPRGVRLQMYFVDGDCCIWLDNGVTLTQNQPIYWSALTGDPALLSPFTVLGSGVSDPDPTNPGGRVLRGYVLVWAVDPVTNGEINWNHLKGDAVIVNYAEGSAWEYNAWAFKAHLGLTGDPLPDPGTLDFNGVEFDFAPNELLLDFYATGTILPGGPGTQAAIDTDLTLWAALKDLRQDPDPPMAP